MYSLKSIQRAKPQNKEHKKKILIRQEAHYNY